MNSEGPKRWQEYAPLIALVILAVASISVFFAWPRIDHKAELDRQIQESWMSGREVVDALEFFEKGGAFESENRPAAEGIDEEYVIPLVKKLRDEHHLNVMAILRDDVPNTAMAILAEAPADRQSRNAVRVTILETADAFPGLTLQNWSHQWVSIDFFDTEEMTVFKPQSLERLKASQRRME